MLKKLLISIQTCTLVMMSFMASSQVSSDEDFVSNCSRAMIRPSIGVGALLGGQINSGGFYYKSGTGVHLSAKAIINPWLSIGVGGGLEKLQKEWIYPVFAEVTSNFSNKPNSGFFILQSGYSFSDLEAYEAYEGYKGRGGFMISPGWGYRANLRGKTELFFTAQYRHQGFSIEYSAENGYLYRDKFSYNFIVLKTGFAF